MSDHALRIDWQGIPEATRAQLAGNLAGSALRRAFPGHKLEGAPGGQAWATWDLGVTVVVLGRADGIFQAWAGHGLDVPEVEHPHSNSPDLALRAALGDLLKAGRDARGVPLTGEQMVAINVAWGRLREAAQEAAAAAELARLPDLPADLVWRVPRAPNGTRPRAHIVDRFGLAKCGLVPKAGWNPWPGEASPDRLCERCMKKGGI